MQFENPLVSVIVPSYNHEKYISKTIESIINQTYKNIELIVIDDGSKDDSPKIIDELSKKYKFYYEHQENIGLSATLNKMIKMAKGKYISIIASDDIATLDKIDILVKNIEKLDNSYGLVCANAKFINSNSEVENKKNSDNFMYFYTINKKNFDINKDFGSYISILNSNYIPVLSTLIRKDVLMDVGLYEENICLEDWNMWLKISKKYKMQYIDEIVAFYRWHETNISTTMNARLSFDVINILEREKSYCLENNIISLWRNKYYNSIIFLLRNNLYKLFFIKIIKNNFFLFSLFIFKKISKNLSNFVIKKRFQS